MEAEDCVKPALIPFKNRGSGGEGSTVWSAFASKWDWKHHTPVVPV